MLRELTPGVWEALDDLFLPGGLHFPVRMTVVRVAGGGLWVHSPIGIDDATAAQLADLGRVEHM